MTRLMDQQMEFFIHYQITFHCPPPPIRTPRRQEDTSELSEHLRKSPKNTSGIKQNSAEMEKTTNDGSPQGVNHEFSEHSLVSLDPMRSIRNLHIQQRQNRLQSKVPKVNETHSESPRLSQPQEANLISFTLPHGQQSTNKRNNDEPKRQRSPRKKKTKR